MIEVCNKRLVEITGATGLTVETIIPRLSPDDFEKIREEGKNVATETQYYEDGCWIFKERKSYSSYSEEKHVEFIKSKILESLEKTKQTMVSSLYDNVRRITTKYKETLKENMDKKTAEYNDLQRRMTEAEKMRQEMAELASVLSNIEPQVEELRTFKGGIEDVVG